mgnify:CR=1 FL=1
MIETVAVPKKKLSDLLNILRHFSDLKEELEDYLMCQDKNLLRRLKKSEKEFKKGKTISSEEFHKKYDL